MAVYVLDTNVILAEGKKAFYSFGSDDVVIPYRVLKELESKRGDIELGYYSREALNEIASLKNSLEGDIQTGVPLGKGFGKLRIELNHIDTSKLPAMVTENLSNDVRILAVAHALQSEGEDVTLVTRDVTLQILADIVDVKTIALDSKDTTDVDALIQAVPEFSVNDVVLEELYANGNTHLENIDVPMNTGVLLNSHDGSNSALAVCKAGWRFELIKHKSIGKIDPKGREQSFAVQHLMDNSIGVVSISGTAGAGKSFLMLAAALALVEDKSTPFEKVVVFRPVNPVGGASQELGFLPGTMDEKMAPIKQPIFDTLSTFKSKVDVEKYKRSDLIEFRSIAHARGSTLANCIVICDELQNLEKTTIGTLLTRAGVNSRFFLGWDTAQRDTKYIGKYDGVYKVVKYLYGKKLFAHIALHKSQRSDISAMVAGILEEA